MLTNAAWRAVPAEWSASMPTPTQSRRSLDVLRISREVEAEQVSALGSRRATRDHALVSQRLDDLAVAARGSANLVPPMLDAVRAEATVGEICGTLRAVFGGYTEPPDF